MEFTTGQILGRSHLGVLRDNDDFFNSLADRHIAVPAGVVRGWESTSAVSQIVWDGWHLKRSDMDTLYYYATLTNDNGSHPTTLTGWYDYNNDYNDTQLFTRSSDGTSSGSTSLSSFPNGLYRVVFIATRDSGDTSYDATMSIRAPYTIYTGSESYSAGPSFADASTSSASDFNTLRSNDIFFNAITPSQVAVAGLVQETTGTSDIEIFNGWDKFHPDHRRLYYQVYLDEYDTDNIRIYYDADDVDGIQSTAIGTEGWTSSYWDFADNGYTKGNWYRVRVILDPSGNSGWRLGRCNYVYITAASLDASYTVMDPFSVDQYVYGDTVGQDTRLELLTDNDASIYDRLTWGSSNPGRMDFACYMPEIKRDSFGWNYGDYRLKRRGDTLYYRTLGAELVLPGGESISLDDYDGSGDYNSLDLNGIDLPHGEMYYLRRTSYTTSADLSNNDSQVTDETLEFAMEV